MAALDGVPDQWSEAAVETARLVGPAACSIIMVGPIVTGGRYLGLGNIWAKTGSFGDSQS